MKDLAMDSLASNVAKGEADLSIDNLPGRGSKDLSLPKTSFTSRRINKTTFLVVEDDAFGEQPYIYIKVYSNHIIVTDTGCNTPRQINLSPRHIGLREYLESYPLGNGKSLNPGGKKAYIIICSHCHYDHILGITQFLSAKPTIIASDHDTSFILTDLSTHSLCRFLDVETPQYTVSHWAHNLSYLSLVGTPLRIQFLHIPGHTPDSLAWYDLDEHHLYVGDTFYERQPSNPIPELPDENKPSLFQGAIIFPDEGANLLEYSLSLDLLLSFVLHHNKWLNDQSRLTCGGLPQRVKIGCGHLTYDGDAETMIREVKTFFTSIIQGNIPVDGSVEKRGTLYDLWLDPGMKYSVLAPRHLVEEARRLAVLGMESTR